MAHLTALDRIIAYKHDEVTALKAQTKESQLLLQARDTSPPRGFCAKLEETVAQGKNGLICEIKRKSPSAGDILLGADPVEIASQYQQAGASCLSVLTDGPSFGGSLEDLKLVRNAVNIPILRKDFMVDPIQIIEERAHKADCILIIMAALDDACAKDLLQTAQTLGMDALVEVHDEVELERAHHIGASFIGINNRNLKEMTTDLGVSERLATPQHSMVSESGVKSVQDIERLRCSGFRRFLIGESLMKETDRVQAVRSLVNAAIY